MHDRLAPAALVVAVFAVPLLWAGCGGGSSDPASCTPVAESCNDVDDDCDGEIDEAGATGCTAYFEDADADGAGGASACLCVATAPYTLTTGGDCADENADVFPGAIESCNGVDDDCSGVTDQDLPGCCAPTDPPQGCGVAVGACTAGTSSCGPTFAWGPCLDDLGGPVILPGDQLEVCNGVDDDCDGSTDEELSRLCYGGPPGTLGVGACSAGAESCESGAWVCTGDVLPVTELCNGADDDCDGQTDEEIAGAACDGNDTDSCNEGTLICQSGQLVCSDATGDDAELCNAQDDDCDPIEQQAMQAKKLAMREEEAKNFSQTSVDIQMVQSQLRNLDLVLGNFVNEREKLSVEIKSTPRIAVSEPAEKPLMPSNTMMRLGLTFMAILASLCLPVVGITLWDTRIRRINTAADVSQGLRLPVIGSMPLVPARVIRQLGSPSPRHRSWHLRLTESVDGIAAQLLRKADVEQSRVIMVSSATGGEGKTTLATQLALSLARTGRRTVLVDFDLRRPSFDEMFGMPLSPGVSESLRHECDVADLVHSVAADNLAVITAGRWDRQALASLSNGSVDSLFRQLREDFDFVVVDTSPILPVADARFVSQFVDTVVLSVFRDVSEAAKIQAACDILAAFGAHCVEAVVTGPSNGLYGRHTGYESTVSA